MGKGDEKMLERGKMDRDLVEFVVIDQLVPKEHLLRKIDAAVDFTRLYEMVEPLYCEDNGRPSIDPVVLFKMVLIQHLYGSFPHCGGQRKKSAQTIAIAGFSVIPCRRKRRIFPR